LITQSLSIDRYEYIGKKRRFVSRMEAKDATNIFGKNVCAIE